MKVKRFKLAAHLRPPSTILQLVLPSSAHRYITLTLSKKEHLLVLHDVPQLACINGAPASLPTPADTRSLLSGSERHRKRRFNNVSPCHLKPKQPAERDFRTWTSVGTLCYCCSCVPSPFFTFSFPSSTGLRRVARRMSGMIATLSPDMSLHQNTAAAEMCGDSQDVLWWKRFAVQHLYIYSGR